jgi:CheY-like chemotaxis protein
MPAHGVLVVEDEEMIRDSLVEYLSEKGFDATGAIDGRDALEQLQAASVLPCVIVLDLMMPVMDGRAFRARQLADARLANIPVIIVSAYQGAKRNRLELNVPDCLDKPLRLRDLLVLVDKYCRLACGQ